MHPLLRRLQPSPPQQQSRSRGREQHKLLSTNTMKALLWSIMLLSLLSHVLCDCQNDCVTCNKHLYQHDNFNTLVCIVECEGKIYSSSMWGPCKTVLVKSSIQLSMDSFEEDFKPFRLDDQFTSNFKRLRDLTKMVDLSNIKDEKRLSKLSDLIREQGEEEDTSIGGGETALGMSAGPDEFGDLPDPTNAVAKRFGGFVKGKYSYRKFMGPSKDLQKRYGGFIGVRKSARKWNNQKRFSEFLRQYLGMSTRSAEYDSFTDGDMNERNEI